MSILINISWPVDLPIPVVDYSGSPRNTTLISPTDAHAIARRSRSSKTYTTITVAWMLDDAQYADFEDFFNLDLGVGTAFFSIDLRYPKNSELTSWMARFVEGYSAQHLEGNWSVQAQLDLVIPENTPTIPSIAGYSQFMSDVDDSSGGLHVDFLTADTSTGALFYVKD